MAERLVHLRWDGPFQLARSHRHGRKIDHLSSVETDFGLYQVYAQHPVYGRSLVFIGQAIDQPFAMRISQQPWSHAGDTDPDLLDVYVGRMVGSETITRERWALDLSAAEILLVHAHAPALNATHIREGPGFRRCAEVRVLNWGACAALAREVSGLVWTSAALAAQRQDPYRQSDLLRASHLAPL